MQDTATLAAATLIGVMIQYSSGDAFGDFVPAGITCQHGGHHRRAEAQPTATRAAARAMRPRASVQLTVISALRSMRRNTT